MALAASAALLLLPHHALAQQPSPTQAQLEAATYPVDLVPGGTAMLVGGPPRPATTGDGGIEPTRGITIFVMLAALGTVLMLSLGARALIRVRPAAR